MDTRTLKRTDAVELLDQLRIKGTDIYLIDAVPVIGMCWADGEAAAPELAVLRAFVEEHIEDINREAGQPVLLLEDGERFIARFTERPPNARYLLTLCSLIKPLRLTTSDRQLNQRRRERILQACLEAAAAASDPQNPPRRVSASEQQWLDQVSRQLAP